ncbi:hypothetical protein PAXRUDRAFT_724082 [Paxillus rubicundulus Ve08.2h10]|uniref:GmrSD restriction endonucleases N-terminal domain-containing protein n=1 Tax=Paxillus rubicundulus Ve08.2h10 TaxID=930991 RepID=A0A0D0DRC9_9AGAM|nr:hypothetical protein PAXRUDRAFT_724082 [Paxillus rubicundulus Ve08.2h10]
MSLSDVSDLTELSSDEEVPLSKSVAKKKKGPKEYRITNVLRAPRTTQYTAKSLYGAPPNRKRSFLWWFNVSLLTDQIIENAIDLDPEYQRDVVWHEEKQSGLIDSILRNYYIPPVIFAVAFQEDGSELRTCIDGKQRLTSIQRFIDGQIPHKDSFTNEKLWFKFMNKQIVCVEYNDLNDDQEREIFQRVQLGVALSPAERLQAIVGPWSTVIREIQSQVLGEEGFEGYLDWGHARGRDFQCLATIGYLIEFHPKSTVPGTKALERWLQRTNTVSSKLRADLHETFRIFLTLARDKKYSGSLNRPTRVSPIEFVMIGVLIYLKRSTLSLTQISSAIEKMRKDVRASHQDIRSNTRVTRHLMDFMAKKIKVSELKSDENRGKRLGCPRYSQGKNHETCNCFSCCSSKQTNTCSKEKWCQQGVTHDGVCFDNQIKGHGGRERTVAAVYPYIKYSVVEPVTCTHCTHCTHQEIPTPTYIHQLESPFCSPHKVNPATDPGAVYVHYKFSSGVFRVYSFDCCGIGQTASTYCAGCSLHKGWVTADRSSELSISLRQVGSHPCCQGIPWFGTRFGAISCREQWQRDKAKS